MLIIDAARGCPVGATQSAGSTEGHVSSGRSSIPRVLARVAARAREPRLWVALIRSSDCCPIRASSRACSAEKLHAPQRVFPLSVDATSAIFLCESLQGAGWRLTVRGTVGHKVLTAKDQRQVHRHGEGDILGRRDGRRARDPALDVGRERRDGQSVQELVHGTGTDRVGHPFRGSWEGSGERGEREQDRGPKNSSTSSLKRWAGRRKRIGQRFRLNLALAVAEGALLHISYSSIAQAASRRGVRRALYGCRSGATSTLGARRTGSGGRRRQAENGYRGERQLQQESSVAGWARAEREKEERRARPVGHLAPTRAHRPPVCPPPHPLRP